MMRIAAAVVGVVIVAVVAVIVFGGDEPELSPQDKPTPTATASPNSNGVIRIRIADGGLDIEPLTITRLGRTLLLEYTNTTQEDVEAILAHGAPEGREAIQKALVTGAVIQAGDQRRDGVQVDPGRYTVLVRSPDETTAPTDAVSIQVR
jgi:hypothetical protein